MDTVLEIAVEIGQRIGRRQIDRGAEVDLSRQAHQEEIGGAGSDLLVDTRAALKISLSLSGELRLGQESQVNRAMVRRRFMQRRPEDEIRGIGRVHLPGEGGVVDRLSHHRVRRATRKMSKRLRSQERFRRRQPLRRRHQFLAPPRCLPSSQVHKCRRTRHKSRLTRRR